MNKTWIRLVSLLVLVCLCVSVFAGCKTSGTDDPTGTSGTGNETTATEETKPLEAVDYAASVKLDMDSDTAKVEATVSSYVDGDTTWFTVDKSVTGVNLLKARYIAINTPESTGRIEEWGKAASRFTKEQLSKAESIILESDDENWNIDSTGSRYLVWIWYKTAEDEEYRNLNIEILQNGLAIASSSNNNRYGDVCMAAIAQAKAQALHVYSGQKDPDFFYGEAIEIDLKELRLNIEDYSGMKVAFTGIISKNSNGSVYVENYDAETEMYYGVSVYYQTAGLSGTGLNILTVGNEVRIVGNVEYYATGETWQITGLVYRDMKPTDAGNIQKISEGHSGAFRLTDPATFAKGKVEVVNEDGEAVSYSYAELALATSISMENLTVVDAYTTRNEESSSNGAMTLYCKAADGTTIDIRTVVLYDADGNLMTQDDYMGKTINVKGVVDYFGSRYQIKVFNVNDIEIVS